MGAPASLRGGSVFWGHHTQETGRWPIWPDLHVVVCALSSFNGGRVIPSTAAQPPNRAQMGRSPRGAEGAHLHLYHSKLLRL